MGAKGAKRLEKGQKRGSERAKMEAKGANTEPKGNQHGDQKLPQIEQSKKKRAQRGPSDDQKCKSSMSLTTFGSQNGQKGSPQETKTEAQSDQESKSRFFKNCCFT